MNNTYRGQKRGQTGSKKGSNAHYKNPGSKKGSGQKRGQTHIIKILHTAPNKA